MSSETEVMQQSSSSESCDCPTSSSPFNMANGSPSESSTMTRMSVQSSNYEVGSDKMSLEDTRDRSHRERTEIGCSGWVRLNVGGTTFMTTRQTLMRVDDSFLARLCQEECDLKTDRDESGAFLIDRDPQYFAPILNYLRHGKLVLNPGVSEEAILEEADFYNLQGLANLVIERIAHRDSNKQDNGLMKSVYRVLQCHEEELTNVVSAMTDGWKIVQVLKVHNYQGYVAEQNQEYLIVVVRECPDNGSMTDSQDRAKLLQAKARNN